jgi:3D (Asp-Asp-Asp) domain-containing protein
MQATAYCQSGTTASGTQTRPGIVAADPRVLPPGSLIRIAAPVRGYSGKYHVEDTGAAVKGRIVDIYVPSCRAAKRFGRRLVQVFVLRRGPDMQLAEK